MFYNESMKKILVVEDEPDIRELLGNYLRNEGYDVAAAEDGVTAIALFAKDKYDLVILDIMIPKIDGYGVCEVIKKQAKKSAIKFLLDLERLPDMTHDELVELSERAKEFARKEW